MELNEFSIKTSAAINDLSRGLDAFYNTMNELYATKRGDDSTKSDYVPTREDLVVRILERWRTLGGFVGNGPQHRQEIMDELEALFAPAPAEPKFSVSAAVCKAIINGERLKQLTKDIDDVLITLTDDDKTFDRRRAASRLIMSMIERFITNE